MWLVQGQMGIVLANYAIVLLNAITDPDAAAAKRAFEAMMEMTKIDIAASRQRSGLRFAA